jgi:hypothetical protein
MLDWPARMKTLSGLAKQFRDSTQNSAAAIIPVCFMGIFGSYRVEGDLLKAGTWEKGGYASAIESWSNQPMRPMEAGRRA